MVPEISAGWDDSIKNYRKGFSKNSQSKRKVITLGRFRFVESTKDHQKQLFTLSNGQRLPDLIHEHSYSKLSRRE